MTDVLSVLNAPSRKPVFGQQDGDVVVVGAGGSPQAGGDEALPAARRVFDAEANAGALGGEGFFDGVDGERGRQGVSEGAA